MSTAGRGEAGADRRQRRGRAGEEIACRRLERRGYRILARNWRTRYGELDIVARRGGVLAFIEVKTRNDRAMGEPFEAVTAAKQRRIRRMAEAWLQAHAATAAAGDCDYRFDVISIVLDEHGGAGEYRHLVDAFR